MRSQKHDMGKRRNTMPLDIWDNVYNKTTTQRAIVFLCLFDGLRIPTIRRLSRKPQTICFEPLNNFEPVLYSPTTKNIISSRYQEQIHCPTTNIITDPTINEVQAALRSVANRTSRERAIIHYYGQGSFTPSNDGRMYFFDSKRTSYRFLTVTRLLESSESPITIIIDCNSAGALLDPIEVLHQQRDIVAFFSCLESEHLPSATNMPLDILSSAILAPLKSAIWFHGLNSLTPELADAVYTSFEKEMGDFLSCIIESIALSSFAPASFMQLFESDASLTEITKGFILATRILAYSNVHTISIPKLPPTAESPQWGLWDLYLDSVASKVGYTDSLENIFQEVSTTFHNFHNHGMVPILFFFLSKKEFESRTTDLLLRYVEHCTNTSSNSIFIASNAAQNSNCKNNADANTTNYTMRQIAAEANMAATPMPEPCVSGIAHAIMAKVRKPQAKHFVILAKLYLSGLPADKVDVPRLLYSKYPAALGAGMLALCCCIEGAQLTNQVQILQACATTAVECAPFSALLFGLIVSRMTLFSQVPLYLDSFAPLLLIEERSNNENCNNNDNGNDNFNNDDYCVSDREDVRACAAFAIGLTRDQRGIIPLCRTIVKDPSEKVAIEALISLSLLMRFDPARMGLADEMRGAIVEAISAVLASRSDGPLQETFSRVRPFIEGFLNFCGMNLPQVQQGGGSGREHCVKIMPTSNIQALLHQSVLRKGFMEKMRTNIFA